MFLNFLCLAYSPEQYNHTVALYHLILASCLSLVAGGLTYPSSVGLGGAGARPGVGAGAGAGAKPPKPGNITGLLLLQHMAAPV